MSVKVKICGITNVSDALDAIELGADYLGFNFYPDSKRFVSFDNLKQILNEVPYTIVKVGVFVNADASLVKDVATEFDLDLLQFHGDEDAKYCNQFARPFIKACRPQNNKDIIGLSSYQAQYFLIDSFVQDSYGGTGVVSNWDLAKEANKRYGSVFLSGGLRPDNIEMAVQTVKPYAVDVASGVEHEPGQKDYHKMEEFIKKVKSVRYEQ